MNDITAEMTPENVSIYSYNNSFMKDVLTHYTSTDGNIDSDVLFDEVGNITYFNGQTYTWNANRQLETVLTADNDLIRYYYNENGFLSRLDMYDDNGTVCSGSLSYIWNGDVLVSRYVTDYESDEITYSNIIYDTEGDAVGTVISQTTDGVTNDQFLLYRKNLQGDITGVIDSVTGQLMASYTYDAYGNVGFQPINDNNLSLLGSAFMFILLPQSYRGYTYSILGEELCYYLGSRFYSPRLGRFLNADKHFDTGTGVLGTNVFAYCNNNPVMYVDPTGESISGTLKLTSLIVKVFSSLSASINSRKRNQKAVQILKGFDIYPCYYRNNKKKYNSYVIKKTDGMSEQIFTIYLSVFGNWYAPALNIDATFEERTIREWKQYVAQSLLDMIYNDSVLFQTVYGLMSTHGDLISFLREFAAGKIQTGAFYLDVINLLFSIISTVKIGKQKYIINQLEKLGENRNPNEKMIILLHYSRYSPYDTMDKPIAYMY